MGLSASQARFLQLTARKSNLEYEAQRISFERLQLADKAAAASIEYNDKMSNRKLQYAYNDGQSVMNVDLTYTNYKNYINQQMNGLTSTTAPMFLVSSSGNKIIVSNDEDMQDIINNNQIELTRSEIEEAKERVKEAEEKGEDVGNYTKYIASIDISDGKEKYDVSKFCPSDFMIVEDLDNVDNFQKALQDGIYYLGTYDIDEEEGISGFNTKSLDAYSSISEVYDKTDDAVAQAEYDKIQSQIQSKDKKLEMILDQIETERNAVNTEMESVKKVIEENIDSSFKVFS